jgi:shikimate dehydrogenase
MTLPRQSIDISAQPRLGSEPAARRKLYFVGVTTQASSIMGLFPIWADLLGLEAEVAGYDLPIGATSDQYRDCIERLCEDDAMSGALVTTHKAAVFEHAHDMFDELDSYAHLCREVSCIARRDGRLLGWAKDPITAGLALEHLVGPEYWQRSDGHVVCFGAGGAGLAIAAYLLTQKHRPRRVTLVDRDARRVELAREVQAQLAVGDHLRALLHTDVTDNDRLVGESPAGSLVINATGMGKDTPGSPITRAAEFPPGSIAWDLNYRGELEFLEIAAEQAPARDVRVSDGWRYFLHGWTEVIAEVFEFDLTQARFDDLATAAGDPTSEPGGRDERI